MKADCGKLMMQTLNAKATTKIIVMANEPTKEIKQNPIIDYINPPKGRKSGNGKQRTHGTNRKQTPRQWT